MKRKFNHIEVLKMAFDVFYICTGIAIAYVCISVAMNDGMLPDVMIP